MRILSFSFLFFNDTATTEIYTLSLHDALPICRHLIREKFSDKRELDDDLHNNDTVQEKLSLAARFGVTIYYGSPDKFQFQGIVKALAEKYHLDMPEEELLLEANKWEISHGGLSGRTASQFITHLLGRK